MTSERNTCDEGGAGIYSEFSLGQLTISNSQFHRNSGENGAAVFHKYSNSLQTQAVLVFLSSNFTENSGHSIVRAEGLSTAMLLTRFAQFQRNRGASVSVLACDWSDSESVFVNNTAEAGSAAVISSANVSVNSTLYHQNQAVLKGGAVIVTAGSNYTCRNCTFRSNKSSLVGGAVYVDQNSSFLGVNVSFLQNTAVQMGSGLFAHRSRITMLTSFFSDNFAGMYGSIYLSAAVLSMTNADITRNSAGGRSPGIASSLSTLTVSDSYCHDQSGSAGGCAFLTDQSYGILANMRIQNVTAGTGGALVVIALSDMTVKDSIMTNCSATTDGGLISLRISTLRFFGVTVANIKSSLNYGSIFLLQSTLIVNSTEFRDLSGSAIYGFSTTITIQNTSFQRITTQSGSGVNCAECPILNISLSLFEDNLAKKGGALNSFTSGTSATSLKSTLTNNRFVRNRAVNGGAVYFDSIFVTMVGNQFQDNSASSDYYSAVEMTDRGIGGAVFCVCTTLPFCEFLYRENEFGRNTAEAAGGGLYWAGTFPKLENNVMEMNSAAYGNDVASFPVRLTALTANDTLSPYLSTSTYPLILRLEQVASGQFFNGAIRLALVDQYDSIVKRDSSSSAHFVAWNESAASAAGNTEVVAVRGVFEFSNFTLKGPPGSNQTILITSKGIDVDKKTYARDPNLYYQTVAVSLMFRDCVQGESLQSGECYPCPQNTFSLSPNDSCLTCPREAICYGTYLMAPRPGYWRPDPTSNLFFECLNKDACLGSPNTDQLSLIGECAVGYKGNLCSTCEQQYSTQGNGVCSKCPGLKSNIVLTGGLALTVLCLFTLIVFISIRGATKPRSELAIYFKILLNYLQIVTVASSLNLDWPSYVLLFLRGQQVAGNAADQLLSIECLLKKLTTSEPYYSNVAVYVGLPAGMIACILLFWGLAALLTSTPSKLHKLVASVVLAIFVLHTSLTKVMFSIFTCKELLPGEFWLTSDLSIRCWDDTHTKNIVTIALPGIIIWIVGLPTVCLIVLIRSRRALGEISTKLMFSFLYKGFRPEWYFWEFCILYRKILVVCISVFLTTISLSIQAITMLAVVLISLYAQQLFHPFNSPNFNKLELRSLFASLLTLYGGLYFYSKSTSTLYSDLSLDVLIFVAIISADIIFVSTWAKFVSPIILDTIKKRLSLIKQRYKVQPRTEEVGEASQSKISGQYGEGVMVTQLTPAIHPETFEVPNNTSFVVGDGSYSDQEIRQVDLG